MATRHETLLESVNPDNLAAQTTALLESWDREGAAQYNRILEESELRGSGPAVTFQDPSSRTSSPGGRAEVRRSSVTSQHPGQPSATTQRSTFVVSQPTRRTTEGHGSKEPATEQRSSLPQWAERGLWNIQDRMNEAFNDKFTLQDRVNTEARRERGEIRAHHQDLKNEVRLLGNHVDKRQSRHEDWLKGLERGQHDDLMTGVIIEQQMENVNSRAARTEEALRKLGEVIERTRQETREENRELWKETQKVKADARKLREDTVRDSEDILNLTRTLHEILEDNDDEEGSEEESEKEEDGYEEEEDEEDEHGSLRDPEGAVGYAIPMREGECPSCHQMFRGARGLTQHRRQSQNPACQQGIVKIRLNDDQRETMLLLSPAMTALGLKSLKKMKKGVEKGVSTMRRGMKKGLDEIECGVKKGINKSRKGLEKERKEDKKRQKHRPRPMEEETDESEHEAEIMAPLVIKNNRINYEPWKHSDCESCMNKLPVLEDGAGMWISQFEKEMINIHVTLGDVKYLLNKTIGYADTDAVFKAAGLGDIMSHSAKDCYNLNHFRSKIWEELRKKYPTRCTGDFIGKMKDDDNPAVFISKAAQEYKIRMDREPDSAPADRMMFRKAIMNALPEAVRAKVKAESRIETTSREEFTTIVVYHVNSYREEQEERKRRNEDALYKLTQMQIQEVSKNAKKEKLGIQAAVVNQGTNLTPQQAPGGGSQPPVSAPANAPVSAPVGAPVSALEQAQLATQQQLGLLQQSIQTLVNNQQRGQGQRQWNPNRQQKGRQGGQGQGNNQGNQQQFNNQPGCWTCGDLNHIKRNCPKWLSQQGLNPQQLGQQQQQAVNDPTGTNTGAGGLQQIPQTQTGAQGPASPYGGAPY
ncbi:uncharacterized protein LOC134459557 [Engraulis encrasicolus]|uniref:uncharacterized protein LOC134459557 n=1 Tax=Engraulis encrasicolus TaxID=184585 RepID=UPI002FCFAD96